MSGLNRRFVQLNTTSVTSWGHFARSLPWNSCARRSGGYSSGYSDGGGGQGAADDVYDIVDSDDEEYDVDIGAGSPPQVEPDCAIYCTHPSSWYTSDRVVNSQSVVVIARSVLCLDGHFYTHTSVNHHRYRFDRGRVRVAYELRLLCRGNNLNAVLYTAPALACQEYGSAQARAYSGTQVPMLPNPAGYAPSWDAGGDGDAVEPLGLESAIAAAKASAEAKGLTLRNTSPGAVEVPAAGSNMVPQASPVEEVIDLLSGDDEETADSGIGGKGLGENGQVRHAARSDGTSCNEVVVLDDDTVEETCLVASPHNGLASSGAKPLSSGPDKFKDANASPDICGPPESTDGEESATKPGDDLAGRGDGDEIAGEPVLATKTGVYLQQAKWDG